MKRIAIFAEGQTESIFVRELLLRLVDASKMRLEYVELIASTMSGTRYLHECPNPEINFLIVDVHGDEGVMSSIKERESNLIEKKGYEKIIGLRDMYCEIYGKMSKRKMDDRVSKLIIDGCCEVIKEMRNGDKICLFFAIMEIEAWFLAMYNLFEKVNSLLSAENIKNKLGIDLKRIDPQKEFFQPSKKVNEIMGMCNSQYKKKKGEVEALSCRMEVSDIYNAKENNRCGCFCEFCGEIEMVAADCLY